MALALRKGISNYPYAVSRVQAKRAKLIPDREYEKLLKMDVSEITRTIEDSDYKTEVDELARRFTGLDLLEAALTVNEERTFHGIRQMIGGAGGTVLALYLDRFQVEDLKTVLRGKHAGASREELLKELLLEDLDTYNLFQPLLSDDVKTMDQIIDVLERGSGLAIDMARTLRKVPADAPAAAFEDALDKAYFARLVSELGSAKLKGSDQILAFVRKEIDALNLLNAARWVHARQTGDFTPFVVPGGKAFPIAMLSQLASSKSLAEFQDQLKEHDVWAHVGAGLERAVESGRLAAFQAAVKNWHFGALDKLSRSHPLSILPILVYVLRKDHEVVTLRALARGKAAGLSEERLQELVL